MEQRKGPSGARAGVVISQSVSVWDSPDSRDREGLSQLCVTALGPVQCHSPAFCSYPEARKGWCSGSTSCFASQACRQKKEQPGCRCSITLLTVIFLLYWNFNTNASGHKRMLCLLAESACMKTPGHGKPCTYFWGQDDSLQILPLLRNSPLGNYCKRRWIRASPLEPEKALQTITTSTQLSNLSISKDLANLHWHGRLRTNQNEERAEQTVGGSLPVKQPALCKGGFSDRMVHASFRHRHFY